MEAQGRRAFGSTPEHNIQKHNAERGSSLVLSGQMDPGATLEAAAALTTVTSSASAAWEKFIKIKNGSASLDIVAVAEIELQAKAHSIVPRPPDRVPGIKDVISSELVEIVLNSYRPTFGDTQIAYTEPSIGKTTAFQCMAAHYFSEFFPNVADTKSLMITQYSGAALKDSYVSHMAKSLGVKDESDVIACLLAAMTTKKPGLSSILIFDNGDIHSNWRLPF
ncbi:hypothetical protein CYMTET_17214 [Cymbomonas tetramitiformis]|uniref:Uncharacterized protein n=1 Tax=Cymbomonas tetramitiformis TaxID=36881 RepID=A0AAE0GAK9_9CHLO|nr:hypothetical protein CYMTET_17214 [Cymbomonas tetramitiformis]